MGDARPRPTTPVTLSRFGSHSAYVATPRERLRVDGQGDDELKRATRSSEPTYLCTRTPEARLCCPGRPAGPKTGSRGTRTSRYIKSVVLKVRYWHLTVHARWLPHATCTRRIGAAFPSQEATDTYRWAGGADASARRPLRPGVHRRAGTVLGHGPRPSGTGRPLRRRSWFCLSRSAVSSESRGIPIPIGNSPYPSKLDAKALRHSGQSTIQAPSCLLIVGLWVSRIQTDLLRVTAVSQEVHNRTGPQELHR